MGLTKVYLAIVALGGLYYVHLERSGWLNVLEIPFSQPTAARMFRYFDLQTRIWNPDFVERWKRRAAPVDNGRRVIVVDGDHPLPSNVSRVRPAPLSYDRRRARGRGPPKPRLGATGSGTASSTGRAWSRRATSRT